MAVINPDNYPYYPGKEILPWSPDKSEDGVAGDILYKVSDKRFHSAWVSAADVVGDVIGIPGGLPPLPDIPDGGPYGIDPDGNWVEVAPWPHTHVLADITDAGTMAAVDDAPFDGIIYGRQNGAWVDVTGSDTNLFTEDLLLGANRSHNLQSFDFALTNAGTLTFGASSIALDASGYAFINSSYPSTDNTKDLILAYDGSTGTWYTRYASTFAGVGAGWQYDVDLIAAPPTAGYFIFNNATIGSATTLYISDTDAAGADQSAKLLKIQEGTVLVLTDVEDTANFIEIEVGVSVDQTGYVEFPINNITVTGTITDEDLHSLDISILDMPSDAPSDGLLYGRRNGEWLNTISQDANNDLVQGTDGGLYLDISTVPGDNGIFTPSNSGSTVASGFEAVLTDFIKFTGSATNNYIVVNTDGVGLFDGSLVLLQQADTNIMSMVTSANSGNGRLQTYTGYDLELNFPSTETLKVIHGGSTTIMQFSNTQITAQEQFQFADDLIDTGGSAGTAGQVLSSLGAGSGVDWIDVSTFLDGNGMFDPNNNNGTWGVSSWTVPTTMTQSADSGVFRNMITADDFAPEVRDNFYVSGGTIAAKTNSSAATPIWTSSFFGYQGAPQAVGSLSFEHGANFGVANYHGLFAISTVADGGTFSTQRFKIDGDDIVFVDHGAGKNSGETLAQYLGVTASGLLMDVDATSTDFRNGMFDSGNQGQTWAVTAATLGGNTTLTAGGNYLTLDHTLTTLGPLRLFKNTTGANTGGIVIENLDARWDFRIGANGNFQLTEGGQEMLILQDTPTGSVLQLNANRQVVFSAYGADTFTGTATSLLAPTSSGLIIEEPLSKYTSGVGSGWTYEATAATPPASGEVRFNNLVVTSATAMYLHDSDSAGTDMSGLISLLGDRDRLFMPVHGSPGRYYTFTINGTPTDNTTYYTIPISGVTVAGTAVADGETMGLQIFPASSASESYHFFNADLSNAAARTHTLGGTITIVQGLSQLWEFQGDTVNDYVRIQPGQGTPLSVYKPDTNLTALQYGNATQQWALRLDSSGNFVIRDVTNTNTDVFKIADTAVANSVVVQPSGGLSLRTLSSVAGITLGDSNVDSLNWIQFGKRVTSNEGNLPFIGHDSIDGLKSDLGLGAWSTGGGINFYTGVGGQFVSGNKRLRIDSNGKFTAYNYGAGTITGGTVNYIWAPDSGGVVVELGPADLATFLGTSTQNIYTVDGTVSENRTVTVDGNFNLDFEWINSTTSRTVDFRNTGATGDMYLEVTSTLGSSFIDLEGQLGSRLTLKDNAAGRAWYLEQNGDHLFVRNELVADGNIYFRDVANANVAIWEMGDGQLTVYNPSDNAEYITLSPSTGELELRHTLPLIRFRELGHLTGDNTFAFRMNQNNLTLDPAGTDVAKDFRIRDQGLSNRVLINMDSGTAPMIVTGTGGVNPVVFTVGADTQNSITVERQGAENTGILIENTIQQWRLVNAALGYLAILDVTDASKEAFRITQGTQQIIFNQYTTANPFAITEIGVLTHDSSGNTSSLDAAGLGTFLGTSTENWFTTDLTTTGERNHTLSHNVNFDVSTNKVQYDVSNDINVQLGVDASAMVYAVAANTDSGYLPFRIRKTGVVTPGANDADYQIGINSSEAFVIRDVEGVSNDVFTIQKGAPGSTLILKSDGQIRAADYGLGNNGIIPTNIQYVSVWDSSGNFLEADAADLATYLGTSTQNIYTTDGTLSVDRTVTLSGNNRRLIIDSGTNTGGELVLQGQDGVKLTLNDTTAAESNVYTSLYQNNRDFRIDMDGDDPRYLYIYRNGVVSHLFSTGTTWLYSTAPGLNFRETDLDGVQQYLNQIQINGGNYNFYINKNNELTATNGNFQIFYGGTTQRDFTVKGLSGEVWISQYSDGLGTYQYDATPLRLVGIDDTTFNGRLVTVTAADLATYIGTDIATLYNSDGTIPDGRTTTFGGVWNWTGSPTIDTSGTVTWRHDGSQSVIHDWDNASASTNFIIRNTNSLSAYTQNLTIEGSEGGGNANINLTADGGGVAPKEWAIRNTSGNLYIDAEANSGNFYIRDSGNAIQFRVLQSSGQIQFTTYGTGTHTNNSPDRILGVNSSGNVGEIDEANLSTWLGSNIDTIYTANGTISGARVITMSTTGTVEFNYNSATNRAVTINRASGSGGKFLTLKNNDQDWSIDLGATNEDFLIVDNTSAGSPIRVEIQKTYTGTNPQQLRLLADGRIQFRDYGTGSHTDNSPTRMLGVSSTGIIGSIDATNLATWLGNQTQNIYNTNGTLSGARTVTTGGNELRFYEDSVNYVDIDSSTSNGLLVSSNTTVTRNSAYFYGSALTTGHVLELVNSVPGAASRVLRAEVQDAGTNAIVVNSTFSNYSFATPTTGYGIAIDYSLKNASGGAIVASKQTTEWVTATATSEDAKFDLQVIGGGTLSSRISIDGSTGAITLPDYGSGQTGTVDAYLAVEATTGKLIRATAASSNTIYTADDSLTGNRTVTMAGNTLTFSGTDETIVFNPATAGRVADFSSGTTLASISIADVNETWSFQTGVDSLSITHSAASSLGTVMQFGAITDLTQALKFSNYGTGGPTGTVTALLAVDADGDVIQEADYVSSITGGEGIVVIGGSPTPQVETSLWELSERTGTIDGTYRMVVAGNGSNQYAETISGIPLSIFSQDLDIADIQDITATAAEINLLDLSGLTAGYVLRASGATSAAWAQLGTSDLNDNANHADHIGNTNLSIPSSTTRTLTIPGTSSLVFDGTIDVTINPNSTGATINLNGSSSSIQMDGGTTTWDIHKVSNAFRISKGGTSVFDIATNASTEMTLDTNGTTLQSLSGTGTGFVDCTAAGLLVRSTSDLRLKDNVREYTGGIEILGKIDPIRFYWNEQSLNDTDWEYIGFSAQNIEKVLPEAVGSRKDGMKTLDTKPILATLVNVAKLQDQRIERLEEKIKDLIELILDKQ